jgi:hypothetical protein
LLELASDPERLVDQLDDLFLHRTMSAEMRSLVLKAVLEVPASNPILRAQQAVYLVATSSQYQVQR